MPTRTKRCVPPAEPIKPERGPFVLLGLNSTDTEIQAAVSVLMGLPIDYDFESEIAGAEEVTSTRVYRSQSS